MARGIRRALLIRRSSHFFASFRLARAAFILHTKNQSLQIQNVDASCALLSGGDVEEAGAIGAGDKHSLLDALEPRCGNRHVAGSAATVLDRRKRHVDAVTFKPDA